MPPLNSSQLSTQNVVRTATEKKLFANEKRVIRQLLEALLFEQLCDFSYHAGYFRFCLGHSVYRVAGRISGFSRIRINADEMFFIQEKRPRAFVQMRSLEQEKVHQEKVLQALIWQPITLNKLIEDLPTSQLVKQQLKSELEQTLRLCQWNNLRLPKVKSRRQLSYAELESAIDEGHPYHPCFKARTGFSEEDHELYGPENGNQFQLHWLAVRRCYLKRRFNSVPEKTFWEKELSEIDYQFLSSQLADKTADSAAFSLMPIHPWQWNNLQTRIAPALANHHVFYLGKAGDRYQASISVRTLLNVTNHEKANIKLPLNIVNTSSLRTIESHTICTAPVLSDWLTQLLISDRYLQEKMVLLKEYAGIRPTNVGTDSPSWIDLLDGQLGVIFRESLALYCDTKTVVPFAALSIFEQDGKPFIEPWIKNFGCENWLNKLLDTVIIPIWHLLVHHGIAIEAHGQNILLQHNQGWPEKIIVRDFHESLEYVHDYLAQPDLSPIFGELEEEYKHGNPNQYYWMTNVEALRELLVDTLFVFNLSDLAVLFDKYYGYSEESFWQLVYQCFKDYQNSGLTSPQRIAKIDIFQHRIKTESLLDKKFRGNRETEFHHKIENPLSKTSQKYSNRRLSEMPSSTPSVFGRKPCLL